MSKRTGSFLFVVALLASCGRTADAKNLRSLQSDFSVEADAQRLTDKLTVQCMKREGFEFEPNAFNPVVVLSAGIDLPPLQRAEQFGTSFAYGRLVAPPPASGPTAPSSYAKLTAPEKARFRRVLGPFSGFATKGMLVTAPSSNGSGCRQKAAYEAARFVPNVGSPRRDSKENRNALADASRTGKSRDLDKVWEACMRAQG